jgi:hypothetical protein
MKSKNKDMSTLAGMDAEIDRAKNSGKSQREDTDPRLEKPGMIGVDDMDRMRRRKII